MTRRRFFSLALALPFVSLARGAPAVTGTVISSTVHNDTQWRLVSGIRPCTPEEVERLHRELRKATWSCEYQRKEFVAVVESFIEKAL